MSKYPTLNHLKSSVVSLVSYINSLFIPLADAVEELSKAVEGNAGSVDFDNKISWPGCTFTTNPKNSAGEIIQTITDTASGKLKAKKVTLVLEIIRIPRLIFSMQMTVLQSKKNIRFRSHEIRVRFGLKL